MEDFDYEELAPTVLLYKNVVDDCEKILLACNDDNFYWDDASVAVGRTPEETEVDKKIRDTKNVSIVTSIDKDIMWFDLVQKIWKRSNHYALKFNISFSEMETPQLLFYSKGQGFYKAHSDSGPAMPRIFSSVLYLNDVEEGGETYFPYFDLTVRPKAGDMVVFPSNFTFKHEARSPISDDKYVIVSWYRE